MLHALWLRFAIVAVSSLSALAPPPPVPAAVVAVEGPSTARATLRGTQGTYTASILVAAPAARAWAVLSDYAAMAGVMPDIKEARVLRRNGNRVELQQTYQAPYTFGRRIRATLLMQERAPRQLSYQLIQGDQIRSLHGSWALTPVRGGVLLSHQIQINPEIPDVIRPVYFELMEANLQQSMRILKRLIEGG